MPIWLDIETFSPVPIRAGIYRYAEEAEVLLLSYAVDSGPVEVWDVTASPDLPPKLRSALADSAQTIWAQTAFDRVILTRSKTPLLAHVPLERWRDVAVLARLHGLPGGLDKLCQILGVEAKKMDGRAWINLFCVPQSDGSRAGRRSHPREWEEFIEYSRRDVEAMREVATRIPNVNYHGAELRLWHLDQRINDRGFGVDVALATEAAAAARRANQALADRARDLTDGEVRDTTRARELLAHLLDYYGVELPDVKASTIERRLDDPDLPDVVRELLQIRLRRALTSSAKFSALTHSASSDGRLRGSLLFAGASRTGRWSGKVFQPQNLQRVGKRAKAIYDALADVIRAGAIDLMFEPPEVAELVGQMVRAAIIPSPGKRLSIADLSNIEGRVLAWLMGEQWKVDAFRAYDTIVGMDASGKPIRGGPDLYVLAAADLYGVSPDVVLADEADGGIMRQVGKVRELALGYQGAVGAFQTMAAIYGVSLSDDEALEIVKRTRQSQPRITSGWYDLEGCAKEAVLNPGKEIDFRGKLRLMRAGKWLRMYLPSGRALCYPSPGIDGDGVLSYMGMSHYSHKWERVPTYGGKLTENAVQAIARDVLAHGMERAEEAGYEVVLHVHDELVTETPIDGPLNAKGLADLLSVPPPWAPDLPLAAAGFDASRYRKG